MAGSGRISVFASTELQTLLQATRQLPSAVNKQIRKFTRSVTEPVWQEIVKANVTDHLQTRVLSDTARVTVSDQNVVLRSGGIGKTNGVPNTLLVAGTEFGADPNYVRTIKSKKGKPFERHTKRQFGPIRRGGNVVYPAARQIIPRIASLWVQTAVRTIHEVFEQGGAK